MSEYSNQNLRPEREGRGPLEILFGKKSKAAKNDALQWRFCVMVFAGSGDFNAYMEHLSERLKHTTLPIESVDTKHGLVEVVVNGSLYDLNEVFFGIGREFDDILYP